MIAGTRNVIRIILSQDLQKPCCDPSFLSAIRCAFSSVLSKIFAPLLHQESSRSGYLFPLDPYLALASAARVYCLLCVHLHYWGSSRASSLHYVDRMGASFRARAWITTPGIPTSATLPHIGFGGQQTVAPAPLWICTAQLTSPHPQHCGES